MTSNRPQQIKPQTVLDRYRDLGSPVAADDDSALFCEPNFNRYSGHWLRGATLDATYAAVEALRLVGDPASTHFLAERSATLRDFLAKHHDSTTGIFTATSDRAASGLFSIHTAIGLIKGLFEVPCRSSLGEDKYRSCMAELGLTSAGTDPETALFRYLEQCFRNSPYPGSFLDSPESNLPPTLAVFYTANTILFNLVGSDAPERLFQFATEKDVKNFINACLRHYTLGTTTIAGFGIHPLFGPPCVNTTYFGLKSLQHLSLSQTLHSSTRKHLITFLALSYHEGAFSSTLGERPSLHATYFALECLEVLLPLERYHAFLRRHASEIRGFVQACIRPETGGAAFTPDFEHYIENCLAARYAIQVLDKLDDQSDIKPLLGGFCRNQFDEGAGGFCSYPPERIGGREVISLKDLASYFEERDQGLRDALRRSKKRLGGRISETSRSGRASLDQDLFANERLWAFYADRIRKPAGARSGPTAKEGNRAS